MRLDLHCHGRYSYDNHLDPEGLVRRAPELGLDGVCFTEHHSINTSRPILKLTRPRDFLVLRGIEVSTDCGHLPVFGVTDDSWNRWGRNNYLKVSQVIESVHLLGGICVAVHPFRGWESLDDKVYSPDGLDAIETHNGVNSSNRNQLAVEAAMKLGLPAIWESDCRVIDQVGMAYTEFSNPITNLNDLVREIQAGNCRGSSV